MLLEDIEMKIREIRRDMQDDQLSLNVRNEERFNQIGVLEKIIYSMQKVKATPIQNEEDLDNEVKTC